MKVIGSIEFAERVREETKLNNRPGLGLLAIDSETFDSGERYERERERELPFLFLLSLSIIKQLQRIQEWGPTL